MWALAYMAAGVTKRLLDAGDIGDVTDVWTNKNGAIRPAAD